MKFLNFILFFLSVISLYALEVPKDTDGDGRINISKIDHLKYICSNMSYWSKDYELDNDIDATDTKNWSLGKGFYPMGQNLTPFTGGFDGQGHKIINLYINRPGEEDIAFLGATKGNKKIENLNFVNCTIIGGPYTGCIASKVLGNQIVNCSVTGRIEGTDYVGGLVGSFNYDYASGNKYNSSILGCHTDVTVIGKKSSIGGLVGKTRSPIINCSSKGSVTGKLYIGGLVGYNESSSITNCFATSTTIGSGRIGGLVGHNQTGTISDCYAMGDVSGDSIVGGLIGYDVAGKISNSFSVGAITGKIFMGGLVGFSNEGIFQNTFWDKETSGKIKSFGGIAKTTEEMKTKSTFTNAGWDFDNIWNIDDITNMGYPFLRQIAISVEQERIAEYSNILIYPNPAINEANFKVTLLENTNLRIELYSLTGSLIKSIYTGYLTSGEYNFDLEVSNLTNGIYSILLHSDSNIINQWIVIQK